MMPGRLNPPASMAEGYAIVDVLTTSSVLVMIKKAQRVSDKEPRRAAQCVTNENEKLLLK